jgi:hypothetical protein
MAVDRHAVVGQVARERFIHKLRTRRLIIGLLFVGSALATQFFGRSKKNYWMDVLGCSAELLKGIDL